jgi:Asp-tRNA(Asn)/Glu-tRNA(Gln) amidotransferase C subunit
MASIIELMDTLRDVEIPADSNVGYESAVLCDLRADDPTESLPPELLYSQSRSNNMIKEGFSIPKIIEE